MDIFQRNLGALTAEEQKILETKKVFIAGCGGLGGYNAEFCVRAGIGGIVLCDKDVFEVTNLNRQRFSDIYRLGQSKAATAKEKLLDINPSAKITVCECEITADNICELARGCDLIIDALDNVETRLILEKAAEDLKIPLISGAVGGWCGQVSAVYPGDKTVSALYKYAETQEKPSVLVTTVAVTAGYQTAEAIKVLLNKATLRKKLLIIDLEDNTAEVLKLSAK